MMRIKKILDIAKEKQLRDFDTVFIICGQEGSSKSHLGLQCMDYLGGDIDHICLDKTDFIETLKKCQDNDKLVFDEAGDGLFSRDFNSSDSKTLVKTFMVIRAKKLITFLILPSFFMIDAYFRKHRVRGLFYVYKRGKCAFFDKNKIAKIVAYGEKSQTIWVTKPSFVDCYPIYKGKLLEDYQIKKRRKVAETLQSMSSGGGKDGTKTNLVRQLILKGNMKTMDIASLVGTYPTVVSAIRRSMRKELLLPSKRQYDGSRLVNEGIDEDTIEKEKEKQKL